MDKAEARIIDYERRLPRETNPNKVRLMREAIVDLINAAKVDIAKSMNALTRRLIEIPDPAFNLDVEGGRKSGPLSGLYPYLNDVEDVCKEVSVLGELQKYRISADVLGRFANVMNAIMVLLVRGTLQTKDQTVAQYELMLRDVLTGLEGTVFDLRALIRHN